MDINSKKARNDIFDDIVKSRHSVRYFTDEIPSRTDIETILTAGMQAPYAAQAVGENDSFRRFFVFENNTPSMDTAATLMRRKAKEGLDHFNNMIEEKPFLISKVNPFMKKLQMFADNGVLGVGTAPYFIVVAEIRGVPPVAQESISHCMENMWLKTTALNLGFQLVSLTSQMAEEKEFLELLDIPRGKYDLNGCAIGYPGKETPSVSRPDTEEVTKWMD